MESQQEIVRLPLLHSALAELVFADEYTIIYAGDQGITAYDVNEGRVRWVGEEATALAVSGDGTVAAAVNRDEDHAVIYRVTDGSRIKECSFYEQRMPVPANDIFTNPQSSVFSLNRDGTMLAVSFSEGGLQIFDLTKPDNDLIIFDRSDYRFFPEDFAESILRLPQMRAQSPCLDLSIQKRRSISAGTVRPILFFLLPRKQEFIWPMETYW